MTASARNSGRPSSFQLPKIARGGGARGLIREAVDWAQESQHHDEHGETGGHAECHGDHLHAARGGEGADRRGGHPNCVDAERAVGGGLRRDAVGQVGIPGGARVGGAAEGHERAVGGRQREAVHAAVERRAGEEGGGVGERGRGERDEGGDLAEVAGGFEGVAGPCVAHLRQPGDQGGGKDEERREDADAVRQAQARAREAGEGVGEAVGGHGC